MAVPIKALLAGAAVAGLGGTGVWLLYPKGMPKFRTLDTDAEFAAESNGYSGKYAEKYARFLVGTGAKKDDADPKINDDWWEWSFKNVYGQEQEVKVGFKDLDRGAKGGKNPADGKSLQEKCDAAYKADNGKVKSGATATDEFEEGQLWKFCSFNGVKPKTLNDMNVDSGSSEDKTALNDDKKWKGDNKWGTKKKADLLAIYSDDNRKIWALLDEKFKSATGTTGFFSNSDNAKSLKDKCAEAYGQDSTASSPKPTEQDVMKWCSLKGK